MTRHRKSGTTVLALLATGALLAGCATQEQSSGAQREVPLEQRHSLEVVQLRAQELDASMSKADVFLLLGAPAEYRGDSWLYRNGDKTLTVRFRNDHYLEHEIR